MSGSMIQLILLSQDVPERLLILLDLKQSYKKKFIQTSANVNNECLKVSSKNYRTSVNKTDKFRVIINLTSISLSKLTLNLKVTNQFK